MPDPQEQRALATVSRSSQPTAFDPGAVGDLLRQLRTRQALSASGVRVASSRIAISRQNAVDPYLPPVAARRGLSRLRPALAVIAPVVVAFASASLTLHLMRGDGPTAPVPQQAAPATPPAAYVLTAPTPIDAPLPSPPATELAVAPSPGLLRGERPRSPAAAGPPRRAAAPAVTRLREPERVFAARPLDLPAPASLPAAAEPAPNPEPPVVEMAAIETPPAPAVGTLLVRRRSDDAALGVVSRAAGPRLESPGLGDLRSQDPNRMAAAVDVRTGPR